MAVPATKLVSNRPFLFRSKAKHHFLGWSFSTPTQQFRDYLPSIFVLAVATQANGPIHSGDLFVSHYDGLGLPDAPGQTHWTNPTTLRSGWDRFKLIAGTPRGHILATDASGDVWYSRFNPYSPAGLETEDQKVASGWQDFDSLSLSLISVNSDLITIYARKSNGDLYWGTYSATADSITPLKFIEHGWNAYSKICATSEGGIFALKPNGKLFFYRSISALNLLYIADPAARSFPGWFNVEGVQIATDRYLVSDFFAGLAGADEAFYEIDIFGSLSWYRYYGAGQYDPQGKHWQGPVVVDSDRF